MHLILECSTIGAFGAFDLPRQFLNFLLQKCLLVLKLKCRKIRKHSSKNKITHQIFAVNIIVSGHIESKRVGILQRVSATSQERCGIIQILPINPSAFVICNLLINSFFDAVQEFTFESQRLGMILISSEVMEVAFESLACVSLVVVRTFVVSRAIVVGTPMTFPIYK